MNVTKIRKFFYRGDPKHVTRCLDDTDCNKSFNAICLGKLHGACILKIDRPGTSNKTLVLRSKEDRGAFGANFPLKALDNVFWAYIEESK